MQIILPALDFIGVGALLVLLSHALGEWRFVIQRLGLLWLRVVCSVPGIVGVQRFNVQQVARILENAALNFGRQVLIGLVMAVDLLRDIRRDHLEYGTNALHFVLAQEAPDQRIREPQQLTVLIGAKR